MIKVPKKFQLDLSVPGKRRLDDDAEEELDDDEEDVDDEASFSSRVESPAVSFRERLAKRMGTEEETPRSIKRSIIEDDEDMDDYEAPKVKKRPSFVIPKKVGRKLDLRAVGSVPPPREIEDREEDLLDEFDPDAARKKRLAMMKEMGVEEESAPIKKKRARKRKATTSNDVASVSDAKEGAQIPSNLPFADSEDVDIPVSRKKRQAKREDVVEGPLNRDVAIKIVEPSDEDISLDEKKDDAESDEVRRSLEEKINEEAKPKKIENGLKVKVFGNDLRVVFAPMAGTKTITALVMFGTGSKYESLSQNGVSHFLEHMFFKGTKNRPTAQKLSCELDALGCEYNAFTSKEYTGYWIKVDAAKHDRALDVLSDMLINPKFADSDIDKERGVIIEEINMYHENPMMYIEEVFEKCLYGETPAGREILGPKENIRNFGRQNFVDYFSTQYGSNSAVLVISGAVDEGVEAAAAKYFEPMIKRPFKDKLRTPEHQDDNQIRVHFQDGQQANMSLGVRAYDTYHEDKIVLKLLSIILGGSMSSRMFTEVREKRGLAYYVHTQAEFFTDTGYLTTQAGVPAAKIGEAIETIVAEYKKISEEPVKEDELQRAKDLVKGRTVIAFEESDAVANWFGRQVIMDEDIRTVDQFFTAIDKVTAEDISRVAADIFKSNGLNLAVIGPYKGSVQFEKHLEFKSRSVIPGIFGFFA